MTYSRKRQRGQAFSENDGVHSSPSVSPKSDEKVSPEQEIWDTFREEYYEAIEQLPLTLHREFILMRELDEQANGYNSDILPALRRYTELRKSAINQGVLKYDDDSETGDVSMQVAEQHSADNMDPEVHNRSSTPGGSIQTHSSNTMPSRLTHSEYVASKAVFPKGILGTPITTHHTPTRMSVPLERSKPPQTMQEMLSYIAWLSEEMLRASEEKVNLAQAAHDSVDRHIRMIDQAIKEQEALMSSGPNNHLAPILLPLQVPRWSKPTRTIYSPVEGEESEGLEQGNESGVTLGIVTQDATDAPPARRKGKKKGRPKTVQKKPPQTVVVEEESHPDSEFGLRRNTRSLRPRDPTGSSVAATNQKYCYCQQESFGIMIACDGRCKNDWFHLACAGLNEVPKGDWFCRDCRRKKKRA